MAIARDAQLQLTDEMVERFRVAPGRKVKLSRWSTRWDVPPGLEGLTKDELKARATEFVRQRVEELAKLQDVFWADGRYSLLLIFQGLDGSGKDSTIKHVTSGMNPSGVTVVSFKEPSSEELRHDFLWRYVRALPEQGDIGVFNRSFYEDVIVVRVNPQLLTARRMPLPAIDEAFWRERFEAINDLERHLSRNGTAVLKFFLHLSRDEQKKHILKRLEQPQKQWKFSANDLAVRDQWDAYQRAYEAALSNTSTEEAPWWIMPADGQWAMRALVAHVVSQTMKSLDLRYPSVDDEKRRAIQLAFEKLNSEK
jgi:PPK2 family polyphosphate:nucleotide phosphotransferase